MIDGVIYKILDGKIYKKIRKRPRSRFPQVPAAPRPKSSSNE